MFIDTLMAGLLVLPMATEQDPRWLAWAGDPELGPGYGRRIVLVSGDEEYRSEEALPMLGRMLARHGYETIVLFSQDPETGEIDPEQLSHIPGLHLVDDADVLVLQLRFRELPDDDMKHIVDHVEAGKPIVGIRTSTHAFNYIEATDSPYANWTWNSQDPPGGFGGHILGETWVNHHGHHGTEATRGIPHDGSEAHPVLRGVTDVFGPTDVYGIRKLPSDSTILLDGAVLAGMTPDAPPVAGPKNDPMHPVAWVRERPLPDGGTQRVLATTMGTAADFSSRDLRRLLLNGVTWCAGSEHEIPEEGLDATMLAPWAPTPFGFGTHRRGNVPGDHRDGSPWATRDIVDSVRTQGRAEYMRRFESGNVDRIADAYAADAVVLPEDGVPIQGRDRIRAMLQSRFDEGVTWMDLEPQDIHVVNDDGAIETGRYRIGPHDSKILEHGSYALTWRRIDGRWMIQHKVFLSSANHEE
tara:strand:+ start:1759 stop:3165 length:1407 start_codon:yes stop_codon:yes gene_type:complete